MKLIVKLKGRINKNAKYFNFRLNHINNLKKKKMRNEMKKKLGLFTLDEKKMTSLKGGGDYIKCCCACAYANSGGSSTADNGSANFQGGLMSPECIHLL